MQKIEDRSVTVCPRCGEQLNITSDTTRFLRPGTTLQGKFVVGKVLGAGGFGNTYIGWNKLLQCKVAIKEYFPRQLSLRDAGSGMVTVSETVSGQRFQAGLQQFLEEARSIAGLQDVKGVIQIYTFFEEYGTGYFVMEYLEGMDVKHILKLRGGRMEYEDSRRIILTVLHTLRELHARGVLHRDIAPDNVYVTKEGVIKLIDFGAAKHASEVSDTQAEIMLKPGYAPPEQYHRNTRQGPYTDLYAVAALFYHLLVGHKPPAANKRLENDQLQSLSQLGIQIPDRAEYAIMCCLNLKPHMRLQSANAFMEALGGEDFVPVYEPQWILPAVQEQPETLLGRMRERIHGWNVFAKAALLIGMILVLSGGVVWGVHLHNSMTRKEQLTGNMDSIPQCVGESEEDARSLLAQVDIEQINVVYRYAKGQETPMVENMEPPSGTSVEGTDSVTLYIVNKDKVTIPDYTGKTKEEADSDLSSVLGEKYKEIASSLYEYNYWDNEKNTCHGQTKVSDVSVEELSELKIQISWGKKSDYLKTMPDLRGCTLAEAKQRIAAKGLQLQLKVKEKRYSDNYSAGKIMWQSLTKGHNINNNAEDTEQYKGNQVIQVIVSRGAKPQEKATQPDTSSNDNNNNTSTSGNDTGTQGNDFDTNSSQQDTGQQNDFDTNTSQEKNTEQNDFNADW
jgi:serine/threonine protein kinase